MASGDLQEACDRMTACLSELEFLIHQPDQDGSPGAGGKPASRPPWNAGIAYVVTDVHEGARRLEAALREMITGRPGPRRGGSDGNTVAALAALTRLAAGLGADIEDQAAAAVSSWLAAYDQQPAIDNAPVWRTLRAGPDGLPPRCPYCELFGLRYAERSLVVMCFAPCCPGDGTGQRPQATMEIGAASGTPMLVWAGGAVQYPPAPAAAAA